MTPAKNSSSTKCVGHITCTRCRYERLPVGTVKCPLCGQELKGVKK